MWRGLLLFCVLGCGSKAPELTKGEQLAIADLRLVTRDVDADLVRWQHADDTGIDFEGSPTMQWHAVRQRFEPLTFKDAALADAIHEFVVARDEYLVERDKAQYGPSHAVAARDRDDTAVAELEKQYARYELPPVPPLPVKINHPKLTAPPAGSPGPAFLWVGNRVVVIDLDGNVKTIATDATAFDAWSDGTAWACSSDVVTRWKDNASAPIAKPPIRIEICAAGPNGKLWAFQNAFKGDSFDPQERIAMFDGTKWGPVVTVDGKLERVLVDRDDHVISDDTGYRELVKGKWLDAIDTGLPYSHMFRGGDDRIYAASESSVVPLTPKGVGASVATPRTRGIVSVDVAGVATMFEMHRAVIAQGDQRFELPYPVAGWPREGESGPFAYDRSGRIWVQLRDGMHVYDRDWNDTFYAHGALENVHEPPRRIVVIGNGPPLPKPIEPKLRMVFGRAPHAKHTDIKMCGITCKVKTWTARTDDEGFFQLDKVPLWKYTIEGGGAGKWTELVTPCCGGDNPDLGNNLEFVLPPLE